MAKQDDLTADYVRSILDYDPETGEFRWKIDRAKRKIKSGDVAGRINEDGYRRIGIIGKLYPAHRLAWLLVYGEFPVSHLDHVNGARDDNRLCNLRLASQSQNIANARIGSRNTTGFKGVSKTQSGKYLATIKVDGKSLCLGTHDTPEQAHSAYMDAALEAFKEFARAV
jgi:hypothetical protein